MKPTFYFEGTEYHFKKLNGLNAITLQNKQGDILCVKIRNISLIPPVQLVDFFENFFSEKTENKLIAGLFFIGIIFFLNLIHY